MTNKELIAFVYGATLIMAFILLVVYLMINYSMWWVLLFISTPRFKYTNDSKTKDEEVVKMKNDKPIIRHCRNCKYYDNKEGYYDCSVRYVDITHQRLSAIICKFYKCRLKGESND